MSDTSLNKVIQYGTTAARTAFTPNPATSSKVLYIWYDTDNAPNTYIWNGSAWVQINSSGGFNQLTGDVTAGPGTGSQAATLANTAVTPATYGDSTHVGAFAVDAKGRITAAANIAISGGGGGSDWTTTVIKSTNQDVTNQATPQNDSELLIAMTSGEVWRVQGLIIFGGNDASNARFNWDFQLPTMFGTFSYIGFEDPSLSIVKDTGSRISNETLLSNSISPSILGTQDAAFNKRILEINAYLRVASTANFRLKFANAVGGGGVTTRVFAGSILRGLKLI